MAKKSKILIAGATGFIGRNLVMHLHAAGYDLRCLARRAIRMPLGVEMVNGDLLDPELLHTALKDVDTAYYLVHSLDAGVHSYSERDRQAAKYFVAAADDRGLRRVIYLSGLGDLKSELSEHLRSRQDVATILANGGARATILRAAIIIGAGGASYEILRFLVKTQLLLPEIEWLGTRCQPIALDNVIRYLVGCLEDERTIDQTFDIGGPEVLTYKQMLETFAEVAGTTNLFFPVPFYSPKLTATMIGSLSTINPDVALALFEGMKNDVVCTDHRIRELIPQKLIPYADAVEMALQKNKD